MLSQANAGRIFFGAVRGVVLKLFSPKSIFFPIKVWCQQGIFSGSTFFQNKHPGLFEAVKFMLFSHFGLFLVFFCAKRVAF